MNYEGYRRRLQELIFRLDDQTPTHGMASSRKAAKGSEIAGFSTSRPARILARSRRRCGESARTSFRSGGELPEGSPIPADLPSPEVCPNRQGFAFGAADSIAPRIGQGKKGERVPLAFPLSAPRRFQKRLLMAKPRSWSLPPSEDGRGEAFDCSSTSLLKSFFPLPILVFERPVVLPVGDEGPHAVAEGMVSFLELWGSEFVLPTADQLLAKF